MLILFSLSTIAQSKKEEKEERIRKAEMPKNAIILLENFKDQPFKKNTFFFETDGYKKSYEAKFKFNKKSYIKFIYSFCKRTSAFGVYSTLS